MYSSFAAEFSTWSSASTREVPGHELDDRPQADHRRADADAGEPELGDRRVDDAHLAEFLEQAFRDLVCALIDARPPLP